MLPYSLRLALRHFSRKRIYSSIIVMSLTVGFACTCLLVSFLSSESAADSFHLNKDRIYQVSSNDPFGGGAGTSGKQGMIMYQIRPTFHYFLDNYPEVENACQVSDVPGGEIEVGEEANPLKLISADTSFFSMFDFPVVAGTKKGITPEGIMISVEKAKQIFGTPDVVGKLVNLRSSDTSKILAVTGVFDKGAEKSHLKFDAVIGRTMFEKPRNKPGGVIYVMLRDRNDPADLMAKYNNDSLRPTLIGQGNMNYTLHPLEESYFNQANAAPFIQKRSKTFIWIGWIVCGVILFMASFNFVNLFLLSIQERRKETGIQKTLGISLWQTIRSSAVEAGLYIGLSLALSLILAYSLIPIFNNTLNADLQFDYLSRVRVLMFIGGLLVLVALVVIVTSTLQQRKTLPVSMMRNVNAKVRYSKLFFTVQFFVSITLCVCTITIVKQMKYLENEPLGFNRNIIQLNAPRKESKERLGNLKTLVSEITGVERVAQSNGNPISGNMIVYYTLEDQSTFSPYLFSGDEDFMNTLDLKLIEGRFVTTDPHQKVVNETLVKKFGMKNPVGMKIPGTEDDRISGVVKDFTCSSFKQEIPPVIISYTAEARNLLVDFGTNHIETLLPALETAWSKVFPDEHFDYKIIQQDLMNKYSEETLFYKIVLAASVTSMIISCFGMFALSWAVTRSRSKEMGIRKVLGASVSNILGLLTISFAKRLVLAFLLAAPAGYYLMNLWLSRFVNKAPIDMWVFVITGISLAAIAVVTLGAQTLRASLSSPLEEIKE